MLASSLSVLPFIHPFVDMEVLSSCWMDFCGMYCFIKSCQKFRVWSQSDNTNRHITELPM